MPDNVDPITGDPVDTSPGTPGSGWGNPQNLFTDPITGDPVDTSPGTPGPGWGNPGDWGTFLTDLQKGGFGDVVKNLFGGQYGGQLGQLAAFGGLAALLNKMAGQQSQQPVGYQGGIPVYTINREQTSAAQQRPADYRPGQGGITYFNPVQYTATGKDLTAAKEGQVIGGGITSGTTGTTTGTTTGGTTTGGGTTGGTTIGSGTIRRPTSAGTTTQDAGSAITGGIASTGAANLSGSQITAQPGGTAQSQTAGVTDPTAKLLSTLSASGDKVYLSAAQDLLKQTPVIADIVSKVVQLDPTFNVDYATLRNLEGQVKSKGAGSALTDLLMERQGVVGGSSPNMGNPEWAAIQKTINQYRAPVAKQEDWQKRASSYKSGYEGGQGALWRDPSTGYGVSVELTKEGTPAAFSFYDQSGRKLNSTTFKASNFYEEAEKYGINLSGIGNIGKQLEEKGVPYKPYEQLKGTGSDAGIDFDDIARGGLGSAYDWTIDPDLKQKVGQYGESSYVYQRAFKDLQEKADLAKRLGLQKYTSTTSNLGLDPSRLEVYREGGNYMPFAIVTPGGAAARYATSAEAQAALKTYPGAKVYDLRTQTPSAPVAPGGQAPVTTPGGLMSLTSDELIKGREAQPYRTGTAATTQEIQNLYQQVFGRRADPEGLEFYRASGFSPEQIKAELLKSEEYKKKSPGGAAGGLGSIIRNGRRYAMGGGIEMLARGRYLKGNGDGVSDSIPAQFAGSGQPAALADGEFVIPARVVSELGNGSSDAGARKLYAMLDRVEKRARKAKRGKPSGADRELNKLA